MKPRDLLRGAAAGAAAAVLIGTAGATLAKVALALDDAFAPCSAVPPVPHDDRNAR